MRTVRPELLAQLNQSASVLQENLQSTTAYFKRLGQSKGIVIDDAPVDRPDYSTRYNCKKVNNLPHGEYLVEVLSAKCHNTQAYEFGLKILKSLSVNQANVGKVIVGYVPRHKECEQALACCFGDGSPVDRVKDYVGKLGIVTLTYYDWVMPGPREIYPQFFADDIKGF